MNAKGSALIIVMVVCLLLSIVLASLTFMTSNLGRTNRRIYDRVCANAISEAGIADTLTKMSIDGMYNVTNPLIAEFAGGQYIVKQILFTNNGHIYLSSSGKFRTADVITGLEVLGDLWALYDEVLGVDGVIISGGNIILDSSAINITGTIRANGNIINLQGNPNVNGSISSAGVVTGTIRCTGNIKSNQPKIIVPDYRPFTDWEKLAKTNGLYYSNSLTLKGETLSPNNGLIYVNGDLVISGHSTINGTIICSGNITIINNFTQNSFNTNWPSILAAGNIILNNKNDLYGVIFAGGNIIMQNYKNIYGALIAIGNVEIKNNVNLISLHHNVQWSPFDTNGAPNHPITGGWLQ